jgi:hypothetical protein
VDFVSADMPEGGRKFLQMVSVFAEWEAHKISERTKSPWQMPKPEDASWAGRCPRAASRFLSS